MIRKSILFIFAVTLLPFLLLAQTQVAGVVYHDQNANGKRERGEPGLTGVSVSNGVAVVQTGENGEYTLPLGDDNIVFVIKPTGFRPPMNEWNQPQGYYIHKPQGSPKLKYAGSSPT